MKAVPFSIPKTGQSSYLILNEKMESFYPYLHKHEEIQICWIKKGTGTLVVEADVYHFEANDVFIIASNRTHLFKNEHEGGVETLSLFFSADSDKNKLFTIPELEGYSDYFSLISSCNRLPSFVQEYLDGLYISKNIEALMLFVELVSKLKNRLPLANDLKNSYSHRSDDKIRKTIEYTIENLNKNLSIAQLASNVNYSPEAFCRFFRKRTGRTYFDYLNDLRINTAALKILQQEVNDVKRAAFDVGFNNVSHFNRVFKKYKGCSPLQYKKQRLTEQF